jgi:hypothetical protein
MSANPRIPIVLPYREVVPGVLPGDVLSAHQATASRCTPTRTRTARIAALSHSASRRARRQPLHVPPPTISRTPLLP